MILYNCCTLGLSPYGTNKYTLTLTESKLFDDISMTCQQISFVAFLSSEVGQQIYEIIL